MWAIMFPGGMVLVPFKESKEASELEVIGTERGREGQRMGCSWSQVLVKDLSLYVKSNEEPVESFI